MKKTSRYTILKKGLIQLVVSGDECDPVIQLLFDSHAEGSEMHGFLLSRVELNSLIGMLSAGLADTEATVSAAEVADVTVFKAAEQKISDIVMRNLARDKRKEAK